MILPEDVLSRTVAAQLYGQAVDYGFDVLAIAVGFKLVEQVKFG